MLLRDFTKEFKLLDGQYGDVRILHALYGNQKYNRCVLHPLVDDERIGLVIDDEDKYVTMDELCGVSITNNEYCIKSDVMELYIKL